MNKLSIFIVFLFFSCHKTKDKFQLDFSYSDMFEVNFSMKIDSLDNIFLRQEDDKPTYFMSKIKQDQRNLLEDRLEKIFNENLASKYKHDGEDMTYFRLIISKNNKQKNVYVYGYTAPKSLYEFSDILLKIKDSTKFTQIDSVIEFSSIKNFYPPPYIPK